MSWQMRIRLGAPESTQIKIPVATLSNATVSATLSPAGTVTITQPVERITSPYLGAGLVTFSGLTPWTVYHYTITQGAETISGTFRTAPAENQAVDYAFVFSTCDHYGRKAPMQSFSRIREIVAAQSATCPVLFHAHIDDLAYVDSWTFDDSAGSGLSISTAAQDTDPADGEKYAAAWAAYYGLAESEGKWRYTDRQWCYQNVPALVSGGDHAIAGNWCRGKVTGTDTMIIPCDRSAGSHEEIAGIEWDYFCGAGNPTPLRAGQWYWKFDAWPLRFALLDISKTCQPYEPGGDDTLSGGFEDGDMYGSQQLSDIAAVMDTADFPFKCYAHESGIDAGQPWADFHATEYAGWKTSFDAADNLNGVAGNAFIAYGDNHSIHYISYDTFWAFSAGVLEDAPVVGANLATTSLVDDGALRQLISSFAETNDRRFGGFWLFEVHGTANPQYISARYIDGGTGEIILGPVYLVAGATNNQWTYAPDGIDYPRPRLAG